MMRALLIVGALTFALAADAHRARTGVWYVRASAKTTVGVVAFSDDGTRALLQEKQSTRNSAHATGVVTRFVVVNGTATLFEVTVSDALLIAGQPLPLEAIESAVCRDRAAALEKALADFHDVRVRASACAKPQRADQLVELESSSPPALTLSDELSALQDELGIGPGLVFANERGPLVVVVRASFDDPYGKSNEALTFLRSDPRIHDRWPAPK
jgi:hypothetical protein